MVMVSIRVHLSYMFFSSLFIYRMIQKELEILKHVQKSFFFQKEHVSFQFFYFYLANWNLIKFSKNKDKLEYLKNLVDENDNCNRLKIKNLLFLCENGRHFKTVDIWLGT